MSEANSIIIDLNEFRITVLLSKIRVPDQRSPVGLGIND